MSQEDVVEQLTRRIEILMNEVANLTAIIEQNVSEQEETSVKFNQLTQLFKHQKQDLEDAQSKLSSAFKIHIREHIGRVEDDKMNINQILHNARQYIQPGQQNALHQMIQQKLQIEQQLRARLYEVERQNALLFSENDRMKALLQHDRMFKQVEMLSGSTSSTLRMPTDQIQFEEPIDYNQQYLNMYLHSREPLQSRNISPPHYDSQPYQYQQKTDNSANANEHENIFQQQDQPIHLNLTSSLTSPQGSIQQTLNTQQQQELQPSISLKALPQQRFQSQQKQWSKTKK